MVEDDPAGAIPLGLAEAATHATDGLMWELMGTCPTLHYRGIVL